MELLLSFTGFTNPYSKALIDSDEQQRQILSIITVCINTLKHEYGALTVIFYNNGMTTSSGLRPKPAMLEDRTALLRK